MNAKNYERFTVAGVTVTREINARRSSFELSMMRDAITELDTYPVLTPSQQARVECYTRNLADAKLAPDTRESETSRMTNLRSGDDGARRATGPTDRQRAFIESLEQSLTALGIKAADPELDTLSVRDASKLIDEMKVALTTARAAAQARPAPCSEPITETGLYRHDGTVYRVKASEGSGHLYAQALTEKAGGGWTYTYTRGMMRTLTPAHRLTLDEAKAFGQQFGSCCVCARVLTDPDSIAAGIGPICRKKF